MGRIYIKVVMLLRVTTAVLYLVAFKHTKKNKSEARIKMYGNSVIATDTLHKKLVGALKNTIKDKRKRRTATSKRHIVLFFGK
jgi:hypothetical protein